MPLMRPRRIAVALLLSLAPVLGCSGKAKGPQKEAILPLLQKEAESLKASGEKVDPSLGVQSTWTIEGLDLREQPKDESNPWVGTVRFKILTRTKDFDGSSTNDESRKQFDYVWSAALGKWIFQYRATPPPRKPS